MSTAPAAKKLAKGSFAHEELSSPETPRQDRSRQVNPDGNGRLTASLGLALVVLTLVEIATVVLGLQHFLSLHVVLGLALIPPLLAKLASVGWRFTRYYTRSGAYLAKGAPVLAMRLLAPLLVAATTALFGSGVAMGVLRGGSLEIARRIHGPASVVWMVLLGIHVLVYLRRAARRAAEDLAPGSRGAAPGARKRLSTLLVAATAALAVAAFVFPIDHRWLDLGGNHRRNHQGLDGRSFSDHTVMRSVGVEKDARSLGP